MATEITFPLHPAQQEIFASASRFKVVGAGRRFGKSHLARVKLIVKALEETNEFGYSLQDKHVITLLLHLTRLRILCGNP